MAESVRGTQAEGYLTQAREMRTGFLEEGKLELSSERWLGSEQVGKYCHQE